MLRSSVLVSSACVRSAGDETLIHFAGRLWSVAPPVSGWLLTVSCPAQHVVAAQLGVSCSACVRSVADCRVAQYAVASLGFQFEPSVAYVPLSSWAADLRTNGEQYAYS